MIKPAQLLHRAHQLCRERHDHVPNSACRKCVLEVFEDSIGEAYPEMKRGDVFELVQEWRMAGQEDEFH